MTTRRNITLDDDVDALLRQTGNASAYISRVVRERWRAWRDALDVLRSAGWEPHEIMAACYQLNGYRFIGRQEMAARLSATGVRNEVYARWRVKPNYWSELITNVLEHDVEAVALMAVAAEYWSGNEAARNAIGADDADTE